MFTEETNLLAEVTSIQNNDKVACVLIDEAQFLSKAQVKQLTDIVDELHIPVLAYGIRTDFLGQTFTGSAALLSRIKNYLPLWPKS